VGSTLPFFCTSLPASWRIAPLKHVVSINTDVLAEGTPKDWELEYVDIGNVDALGRITDTTIYTFGDAPSRARRLVRDGDTVISTVRTYLKAIAFIRDPAPNLVVSTGFAALRPRSGLAPRFLWRMVQSEPLVSAIVACSEGVSYPAIAQTRLGDLKVWLPPLDQQERICRFLEDRCAQIDQIIEEKQRLLDLLAEQKSARITRAVSRGLDPSVPTKDSNIPWLGEIPQHWGIKRLKHLCLRLSSGIQMGPFGTMLRAIAEQPTGFKLYGQENTIAGDFSIGGRWISEADFRAMQKYLLCPDDIVLTRKGASIGNCRLVPPGIDIGIIDSDTIRIRPDADKIITSFLGMLMHEAEYLQEQISFLRRGAILPGLNTTVIGDILVATPPVPEQKQIVACVSDFRKECDLATHTIHRQVDVLREYRSALITATVTGQIDVNAVS
jgi:type I restriction enzyme S subunit